MKLGIIEIEIKRRFARKKFFLLIDLFIKTNAVLYHFK